MPSLPEVRKTNTCRGSHVHSFSCMHASCPELLDIFKSRSYGLWCHGALW